MEEKERIPRDLAKKRVRKNDDGACLTLNDIKIARRTRQMRKEGQKAERN
jgi:hypothetical protein